MALTKSGACMDIAAPKRYVSGERVALFLPCYGDLIYPDVGRAMVTLFARLGVPLEYPLEQTCCGQPAFNAGHWDQARTVAHHFAQVFGGYDWIVVPSGSCAAMCKVFYPSLDPALAEIGARVWELSTFLVDAIGATDVGARFPYSVAYHDGCHARRELKVGDAPLRLLRAVKDARVVDLPAQDECCGFGGLFSVKFDELSASMGERKCANVRSSGAEVLVSADSSCLMQIGGLLARDPATRTVRTMHLAQVLAST
ncbi:MAG TPA: (Fe-S)-binding protein [Candidatus Eremiobacteraceae bacterium]|nr:(Fe-S)-binding protein [Candidatus Eremiobacteraceae bacterium]